MKTKKNYIQPTVSTDCIELTAIMISMSGADQQNLDVNPTSETIPADQALAPDRQWGEVETSLW